MIRADFNERSSADLCQLFTVCKWHNIVGSGMQDHGAGPHGLSGSKFLPSRAQQDELRFAAVDVLATAPPRDDPTTTLGWCSSKWA